jgi:hypothetical protein
MPNKTKKPPPDSKAKVMNAKVYPFLGDGLILRELAPTTAESEFQTLTKSIATLFMASYLLGSR